MMRHFMSSEQIDWNSVKEGRIYIATVGRTGGNHILATLDQLEPSPFQTRRHFDEEDLKRLARSIEENGLVLPIVARFIELEDGTLAHDRFELIAGERRLRSIRDYTQIQEVQVKLCKVDDETAMKMGTSENIHRKNLSAVEEVETYIMLVDQGLQKTTTGEVHEKYMQRGETEVARVKALLSKLDSIRRSEERGSELSEEAQELSQQLVGQVELIFSNLPKPLKWRSFLVKDLSLITNSSKEVLLCSIQNRLNKSQIRALAKIHQKSPEEFERLKTFQPNLEKGEKALQDWTAKEITIAVQKSTQKQAKEHAKEVRQEQTISIESQALIMKRLGLLQNQIVTKLGLTEPQTVKILNNHSLEQEVQARLAEGKQEVFEIARDLSCSEALVWSYTLANHSDDERFEVLGWKISRWSEWKAGKYPDSFGVRGGYTFYDQEEITPQLIAHLFYFFIPEEALIWAPMSAHGVFSDTCLAFQRRCWAWSYRFLPPSSKPEIDPLPWDLGQKYWPENTEEKPDWIFLPLTDLLVGMTRQKRMDFLREFLERAYQESKEETHLAILVEEMRNYYNHHTEEELSEWCFGQYEVLRCLEETGWASTHRIQCPLSKPKLLEDKFEVMKAKKSLGENQRSMIIVHRV